jgi:hypothetical protein
MRIDSYSFGKMIIDNREFTKDVVLFPDHVFSPWWRKEGHYLEISDLPEDLLSENPEGVVIGTGYSEGMKVSPEIENLFKSKGMELIIEDTTHAFGTYNNLKDNKKMVALFHLTC